MVLFNLGTLTRGEMAAKVPEEIQFWLKLYIDNTDQKKMPKAAALKSLENGAGTGTRRWTLSHWIRMPPTPPSHTSRRYFPPQLQGASKFPPTPVIVYQVVIFFIEMMRALLVPANGTKPEKFSQIAALYCLFRLRRMEGMGGPDGGLQNGAECVDLWVHSKFRSEVWARCYPSDPDFSVPLVMPDSPPRLSLCTIVTPISPPFTPAPPLPHPGRLPIDGLHRTCGGSIFE
jgi:hypothetical protein